MAHSQSFPRLPQGGFYALADARPLGPCGADSLSFAFALLERAHVGVTPGIDFGAAAEGWIRVCYAVSESAIDDALERIEAALPALQAAAAKPLKTGGAAS